LTLAVGNPYNPLIISLFIFTRPPKIAPTPQPVATTAAAEAAAAFSQLKPQVQVMPPQQPQSTIPKPVPTPAEPAPVIIPPKPLSTSVSTSQLQSTSAPTGQTSQPSMSHSASTSMLSSMPKSVYDSLAPLNLPSKPLNYGQENAPKPELELSQVNSMLLAAGESASSAKTTAEVRDHFDLTFLHDSLF